MFLYLFLVHSPSLSFSYLSVWTTDGGLLPSRLHVRCRRIYGAFLPWLVANSSLTSFTHFQYPVIQWPVYNLQGFQFCSELLHMKGMTVILTLNTEHWIIITSLVITLFCFLSKIAEFLQFLGSKCLWL